MARSGMTNALDRRLTAQIKSMKSRMVSGMNNNPKMVDNQIFAGLTTIEATDRKVKMAAISIKTRDVIPKKRFLDISLKHHYPLLYKSPRFFQKRMRR